MANFDFITDEALRHSLESDLRELSLCYSSAAWKAVHVLAGSIIEATLIDYLVSAGKLDVRGAVNSSLAQLIDLCRTHNALSNKAVELSTIVRSYRNLIHPGRVLRLAENVDGNGATIAKAVVEIVVEEVARNKKSIYGYTAEQVMRKIEQDASALSIAEHLLRDTNATELRRLLTQVLPESYLEYCEAEDIDSHRCAQRLCQLFRLGVAVADPVLRSFLGSQYVSVLKEQPEQIVRNYELGLFRAADLQYINTSDQSLVVAHLFATMRQRIKEDVLEAAKGITLFLDDRSLRELLKIIAVSVVRDDGAEPRQHAAMALLYHEQWEVRGVRNPPDELERALAHLQEEYKWNEKMLEVLNVMKDVIVVPF